MGSTFCKVVVYLLECEQKFQPGTKLHALHKYVKATLKRTLGAENLHEAVRLPDGEDLNEWIAVNTIDFFNTISLLYGSMSEFCTAESCPIMSAGPRFEYQWADGVKQKRPKRCSAPEYVEHLMSWVQSELDNTELFPTQIGVPFRTDFKDRCRNIMRRLFRVYAHLYHHHLEHVVGCGAEPHLNTCFKVLTIMFPQSDTLY